MKLLKAIFFILALTLATDAHAADTRIAKVLQWLPAETTSISVLNGPINSDLETQALSKVFGKPMPTFQYWAMTPGLSGDLSPHLKQRMEVAVSCLMKCHSKPPDDDGGWRSLAEGWIELAPNPNCKFFFLLNDAADDAVLRKSIFEDDKTFSDEGQMVREVKVDDQVAEYCMPTASLIIWTNDRPLMHQILVRRKANFPKRVALPASLPEWREVNTSAAAWGLRHFLVNEPGTKYSDPECISLASPLLDKAASAIVYDYDRPKKIMKIVYLSANDNIKDAATRVLKLKNRDSFDEWEQKHSTVTPSNARTVQILIPDEPKNMLNAGTIVIDWLFGHRLLGR